MLHFGFKHKDGRLCPLSGSGRVLLSVLYCFSYTNWREIWVPSRTAMNNGTNICHVLILSTGRNLCAREWSVWIFKKHIHRDSYPSTQTCIYFSLTGGKVKKKLGIITMQRDEDDNDPACASESFFTALGLFSWNILHWSCGEEHVLQKKLIWKSPENPVCIHCMAAVPAAITSPL